jgi:hypothetical protein
VREIVILVGIHVHFVVRVAVTERKGPCQAVSRKTGRKHPEFFGVFHLVQKGKHLAELID